MSRTTDEWIGRTPDTPIPPRVKLRVFDRHGGICHLSGRKIMPGEPWDCDHIIALINGGENRESNLAPAWRDKHREKTAADVREKSRVAQRRQSFLGIKPQRKRIQSAGFRRAPPQKSASRRVVRKSHPEASA
jgi:5-methylcytosine-specific restriction endonuclease McrA